jgi:FHA domain-containing protein
LSLIGGFEQRLERAVEGFFARLFKSGVHPVEIGKRLLRVMEDGKTVALRRTYVPNMYRITVGPQDYERLSQLEAKLVEELEIFVGEAARQRQWALPDSPRVSFATDAKLQAGEFRITAEAVSLRAEGPAPHEPAEEEAPATARRAPRAPAAPSRPETGRPVLVLLSDDQPVKTIPIERRVKIGRQADNDLVVVDPGVSRHHAEVINESGTCTLHDLGSTNGTYVNGSVVTEHALRDGDRISLGSTVVEFSRRGA